MKNQRNKTLKLLIYVLLLAIVTSIIISGTFARYTSKTTVDSNAHIAAWNFKVNGFDKVAFVRTNLTDTIAEEKIAPGTEGKLELELNAEGCEVAVKYEIEISKLQDSPEVLKFYKDSDYTIEHPSKKVGEKAVYTINGIMPYSEIIKKPTKDVAIYWKWEYETENGDETDTNIGTSAEDMEYEIKIKATQANEITQEEAETNIVYDYWTNGGDSADKTEEALEFNADVDLTPKAYKEGYEFIGWNTDSSATTGLTELKMTQQRVTLYAIYEKTITANLHYYNNQTKTITGSLYNKNTKATVSELGIEEITGYELRGISTSEQANAEIIPTENGEIEITENEEYYASYTYNVTISFDSNGGQQDIEDITEKAYMNYQGTKIGANITMPTNEETADGYTFISWNETATDEEIGYIEGETYEFEESKTLYKNWSGLGIYAALYSDGTLEFNDKSVRTGSLQASTFATRSARTLVDEWNITDKTFDNTTGYTPWYEHREEITTVNFANKIAPTSTAYWFAYCNNLITIENIENLDTSNVTNMYGMFGVCNSLTSLDLSNFDTSNVIDMSYMFANCSGLTSLNLSGFDTSNVETMGSMFNQCSSLMNLDLSSFDTRNVNNMNNMFEGCSSLTSLDLSSFETTNVTIMMSMFAKCTKLTTILVGEKWQAPAGFAMFSNCGTDHVTYKGIYAKYANGVLSFEKVDTAEEALTLGKDAWYVSMGDEYTEATVPWEDIKDDMITVRFNTEVAPSSTAWWFAYCNNLMNIENIENLDTSNVTNMYGMFGICNSLTNLNLRSFNTSNVKTMGSMFEGCNSLTNLDLSNFDTSNVIDMSCMFATCSGLTNLNLSGFDTSNVETMESMFNQCSSLMDLDLSSFDTRNVNNMNNMFEGCSSLTSLDLSSFETTNVIRMMSMFAKCTKLTTILVGEKWQAPAGFAMFSNCGTDHVTYKGIYAKYADGVLSFEKVDTADEVSALGENAWYVSMSDEYTTYSQVPWDGVKSNITTVKFNTTVAPTSTAYWFDNCNSLTIIENIEGLDTSKVTNMESMFSLCNSLTSLDLSSFDTSNVTDMNDMFDGCTNLTNLNLSSFNTSKVTDMSFMFYDCSNLVNLDLKCFNTSNVEDMYNMFRYCNSLTSLDLTSFDTSSVTRMSRMFSNCNNLKELDLSNFNTTKVTSMAGMFAESSNLTSLDLSSFDTSNVTNMTNMFLNTTKLTAILVGENWQTAETNTDMFTGCGTDHVTYKGIYAKYADRVLSFEKVDTADEVLALGEKAWYVSMSDEYTNQTQVPWYSVRRSIATVKFNTKIAPISTAHWFLRCLTLTNIENIENLDTSRVISMNSMFEECNSLTSINLSNFKTGNVTTMEGMFYNCNSLTSLDLSNFDTSNVTDMSWMFGDSEILTTILVGENWKTAETNTDMFTGCGTDHVTQVNVGEMLTEAKVATFKTLYLQKSNMSKMAQV